MDLNQMQMPAITPNMVIIGMLGFIAVVTAIGVVAFNNPIRSMLSLVANFFTLAFIYFSMGADMMGITQIVVYTGAIMVLFLFVIMLLNLSTESLVATKKFDVKPFLAVPVGLGVFALVLSQILMPFKDVVQTSAPDATATAVGWGSPQAIGRTLFTGYVWPFEVISLLLMVGIVGAILLARRRVEA